CLPPASSACAAAAGGGSTRRCEQALLSRHLKRSTRPVARWCFGLRPHVFLACLLPHTPPLGAYRASLRALPRWPIASLDDRYSLLYFSDFFIDMRAGQGHYCPPSGSLFTVGFTFQEHGGSPG